jgi:type IV pilus assembly protein PilC
MLLRGGLSLHESLLLLKDGTADEKEAALFEALAGDVEAGAHFASAMANTGAFPRYAIAMVRIGEASGRLEIVLEALNAYFIRSERVRAAVRSAVVNPLVLVCLLIVLVGVLLVRVLPVFALVYSQLGASMSVLASGLLSFGDWLSRGAFAIGFLLVLAAGLIYAMWRSERGKMTLNRFFSSLPFVRPLSRQLFASRFSFAMALMLKSGMDFDHAAGMAAELFEGVQRERIESLLKNVRRNEPLTVSLIESGLFDATDARLLQVGARVGNMDNAMDELARRSEMRAEEQLSRVVGYIEPALVTLMAVIAGMVLLSVMLPLLGIMSAI